MANPEIQKHLDLLDCAELHVIEMVRARIRKEVEIRLLQEFATLIQDETEKALTQIVFRIASERDPLSHSDRLHVLVTWAKAAEGRKVFRQKTIIVSEIDQPTNGDDQ